MSSLCRVLLLSLLLAFGVEAHGQSVAPEGNAHPGGSGAPEERPLLHNPFGKPPPGPVGSARARAEAMIAFERVVDLSPLAKSAVFHGGRPKILDSLGRETARSVSTKPGMRVEFEATEDEDEIKHEFSALFTLMEWTVQPGLTADMPLISVDYLPLRDLIARIALEGELGRKPNDEEVDLALRRVRIPPIWLEMHQDEIVRRVELDAQLRDAWERTRAIYQIWSLSWGNWMVIAPETTEVEWHHLAEPDPRFAPAQSAAARLGAAWKARDAEAANKAIADLAEELASVNEQLYPSETRRSVELAYNRSAPFAWGAWIYLFSTVALVLGSTTRRRWLKVTGLSLLTAAALIHAGGFVARCYLAERFAIQNQFESMTGVSLFATIIGAVVMLWRRNTLFGAAAAATGFMVLLTATGMAIPGKDIGREAAILNTSVLLKYHVTIVLTSYGLITLGFVLSLFYLGTHYGPRLSTYLLGSGGSDGTNEEPAIKADSRVLRDLDKATMTVLQLAFWTLAVGILLGAWWADHSWGRWWAWDPKETWALITWIIYLIVIHVRFITKQRDLITAWLSVAGFVVMLWTYFGVNLLLPGLHAYA